MSITDNTRIIVKVCKLYYEENRSQKEISGILGISRPQISRILSYAKSNDIVSVKINNPFALETQLEKAMLNKYPLKDAVIVNTNGLTEQNALEELGKQASNQLDAYIPDGSLVGVMSGKTISAAAKSLKLMERKEIEFIPLIGGIGSDGAEWYANVIAQNFAERAGGKYYLLNAPIIVKSKNAKEILMREPHIGDIIEKAKKCDVAIVGIGEISKNSTTVQAGGISMEDIQHLKESDVVASICSSYVDKMGKIVESDITERSIGVKLEELNQCKTIIAMAMGKGKIEAIKSVLIGGFIDVFITNIETANEII